MGRKGEKGERYVPGPEVKKRAILGERECKATGNLCQYCTADVAPVDID